MTVRQALLAAQIRISRVTKDNPKQQAIWMIQAIMNTSAQELLSDPDRVLTEAQDERCKDFLLRREHHEPLQYLLGTTEFRHIKLKVDRRALIPRPETEGLVEIGLQQIQTIEQPKILDLGAGCGAIVLSLLQENPGALGWGCDISFEALDLAEENGKLLGLQERVTWKQIDLLSSDFPKNFNTKYNLIISNPPYVADEDYAQLPPEIHEFEPALALQAGPEGLTYIQRIAQVGGDLIQAGGHLVCEIGEKQKEAAQSVFRQHSWDAIVKEDLSGKPRYLIAQRG